VMRDIDAYESDENAYESDENACELRPSRVPQKIK
jgi:hypothetical protein